MSQVFEDFQAYVAQLGGDTAKIDKFVNGAADETVDTDNGPIPTLAGIIAAVSERGGVLSMPTIDAMSAIPSPTDGLACQVTTTGRAGLFRWQSGDLSAECAADPDRLVYVPSDDDPSGEAGAWVLVGPSYLARQYADETAASAVAEANEYTNEALAGISAGAPMFLTVAVGMAETEEGDFFVVPGSPGEIFYSTLYRHGAADAAQEIARLPGEGASLLAINYTIAESPEVQYAQLVVDTSGALRVLECVDQAGVYRRFPESSGPSPVTAPTEYVVFLCAGQSNMDGRGDAAECPIPPVGYGYAWNGSALVGLDTAETNQTMLPAFVIEFVRRTGLGVIIVKEATGGSAMAPGAASVNGYWGGAGSTHRVAAINKLRSCLSHLRSNGYAYQFGGVLWSQGERDAQAIDQGAIVIADYDAGISDMMTYFRGELGEKWPLYFVRTGRLTSEDRPGWQAVRDAQDRACATDDWLMMGYTGTLRFPQRGLMKPDGIHYSQAGLNECGTKLAAVAANLSTMISIEES